MTEIKKKNKIKFKSFNFKKSIYKYRGGKGSMLHLDSVPTIESMIVGTRVRCSGRHELLFFSHLRYPGSDKRWHRSFSWLLWLWAFELQGILSKKRGHHFGHWKRVHISAQFELVCVGYREKVVFTLVPVPGHLVWTGSKWK